MRLRNVLIIGLLGVVNATCSHNTFLHRRSDDSSFGYGYTNGPLVWHTLSANNELCKTGTRQSPVNIDESIQRISGNVSLQAGGRLDGTFANLGTTLQVTPKNGKRFITVDGNTFSLKQFHFHTPSEHHINGEYFPLEMHIVHESTDNTTDKKLAVLGILFDVGKSPRATRALRSLSSLTPSITSAGKSVNIESQKLDLAPLIKSIDIKSLVSYSGSLTTPPCTEGVTWLVYQKPMEIDTATYKKFKKAMKFNSRITEGPPGAKNVILMAERGH